MKKLTGLLLAAACAFGAPAHAGTLTIDFDRTPGADGRLGTADDDAVAGNGFIGPVGEAYASAGVHFSAGTLHRAGLFGDADNVFVSSTQLAASFDVPVYGISLDSYTYWPVTMTAYDAAGNVLATDVLANGTGGMLRGTLSITSGVAIDRFVVQADTADHIVNLDNLALAVSPVPEPAQGLLLGAGLFVIGAAARRRAR